MTSEQLDNEVEQWFVEQLDFEIANVLAKLERFGIVKSINGQYIALPISSAPAKLDAQWDTKFNFSKTSLSERVCSIG